MSSVVVNKYFHDASNSSLARAFDISRYHVDTKLKQASVEFRQKLKTHILDNFSDFFQQYGHLNAYTL